jgi:hypothetical protein
MRTQWRKWVSPRASGVRGRKGTNLVTNEFKFPSFSGPVLNPSPSPVAPANDIKKRSSGAPGETRNRGHPKHMRNLHSIPALLWPHRRRNSMRHCAMRDRRRQRRVSCRPCAGRDAETMAILHLLPRPAPMVIISKLATLILPLFFHQQKWYLFRDFGGGRSHW